MKSLEVKQITSCILFDDMSAEHILYIKEQVQSLTFMHEKKIICDIDLYGRKVSSFSWKMFDVFVFVLLEKRVT
jgi:hypothetical protein